jgi:hypothetical protein
MHKALPMQPQFRKIPALFDALVARKSKTLWRFGGHAPNRSDGSEAFAAVAAAVTESGFAALARVAIQEAVLPFAANL